jgi:hypothetical protein
MLKKSYLKSLITTSLAIAICTSPLSVLANNSELLTTHVLEESTSKVDVHKLAQEKPELFDKLVLEEINNQSELAKKTKTDFDQLMFESQLRSMFSENPSFKSLISIPNSVIASAMNVAIGLVIGGSISSLLQSYINKVGTSAARNTFKNTIVSVLRDHSAGTLTGYASVLVEFVLGIIDVGGRIANYLDGIDSKPYNGYLDIL